MTDSLTLTLYRTVTDACGPLVSLWLKRRRRLGKEHAMRHPERTGTASRPRPPGPLLWLHAASVGEAVSILPLIDTLSRTRQAWSLLVTTGTVTSAEMLAGRLPEAAVHQFVPVDRTPWVERFLDHWRPDMAIWVESEIWPTLVTATAGRGIPMALVNGRMSARSAARWRMLPKMAARLLNCFTLILAQSPDDAERFRALGAPAVETLGNLKRAAPPLTADDTALTVLTRAVGDRPVWLAASTHPGEEALIGRVHQTLAARLPGLLTVIVPRHPERGPAIANALRASGLRVGRRSAEALPSPAIEVYIADTLGELGLFYRLCRLVVIGKTLIGKGGQNPLEPARLGCGLLFGAAMSNFRAEAAGLIEAGAARQVADEADLAAQAGALLADPAAVAEMGRRGLVVATAEEGVLERVSTRLFGLLDGIEARHAGP